MEKTHVRKNVVGFFCFLLKSIMMKFSRLMLVIDIRASRKTNSAKNLWLGLLEMPLSFLPLA